MQMYHAGDSDERKVSLVNQLKQLDANYPGGLQKYVANAKRLLEESKSGNELRPAQPLRAQLWALPKPVCSSLSHSLCTAISDVACREERL